MSEKADVDCSFGSHDCSSSRDSDMTLAEATEVVLQLAESKWLHRAWRLHRLSDRQIKAIGMISAELEHGIFPDGSTRKY